ncbi:MAG TPA: DUF5674 family protein [Patescibacteria group bacterium]|nr:DUF5674 family protein [Patescibacteria group bacterium]
MSEKNNIEIISEAIFRAKLKSVAEKRWGDMVKAVVDIEKEIMAIGGEMHADEEQILLENGSEQKNLWGINLYPDKLDDDFIQYDSMINIRPKQNNRSRGVEDEAVKIRIVELVNKLVK